MKRIFVVEDEAVVALELQDRLTDLGYLICGHAARGDAALRDIPGARPDLVLMDISLGCGMSGLDVAEQLRRDVDVPIIFLTAYSDSEFTQRAAGTGSFAYIVKPFDPRVVAANIELAITRHEATLALRESEGRFRALFEQAAVGVAEVDTETGRIVRTNRKHSEILGYSEQELLGLDFVSLTHPDDLAVERSQLDALRRGELREFSLEKRCLRKDGGVLWLDMTVSPLWAPGAAPTRHMAVASDITARRVAEEQLRSSQQHYAGLVAASPVGVYETDPEGRCIFVNEMWSTITGLSTEEAAGEGWAAALHPDDRDAVFREWWRAAAESRPFRLEYRFRRPDGSTTWVLGQSLPLRDGERITGHIGTVTDITARKGAEAELARREEFLRLSQGIAHVGSWDWDIAGSRILWSDEMCRLHGQDPRSYLPTLESALALYTPEDRARVASGIEESLAGRGAEAGEFRVLLPDGTVRTHRVSWQTYFDPAGEPIRMIGANLDITDRKRAEEEIRRSERQLNEAQRLAALGSWDWDVIHDETRWSENLYEIFGVTEERFDPGAYDAYVALVHPDDRERVEQTMQRALETGEPFAIQYRIIRPDGVERHIEANGVVVLDDARRPAAMRGSSQDVTERKQAEQALRHSEERYRLLFTQASEGIFRTGLDGTILDANPALARLLGYDSSRDLAGANMLSFYADPVDRQEMQEGYAEADVLSGVVLRWRKRGGEPLLVELHGRLVDDERGPSHYQGFVLDVTAQERHEAALRVLSTGLAHLEGRAFFEEAAVQLAALASAEVGFVGALKSGPRLTTLGLAIDGIVRPPVDYAVSGTPCEQLIDGGPIVFPEAVRERFPSDRYLVELGVEGYVAASMLDTDGQVIGHVGVMFRRPITHPEGVESLVKLFALRMAAEFERQRAQDRFVRVFEFAPDALLIADEAGRIVMANRGAEETLGYPHEELLALTIEDLVPETERRGHVAYRAKFLAQATPRRMGPARSRLWALHKDGRRVPVEISLSPFESEEDRLVVAAVRDMTVRVAEEDERARLEEQLRQVQKMEALGTLAGGIAHDFNNLLTVITVNVELALEEVAPDSPIVESLQPIAAATSRAAELVRQILTFSRKQPVVRVPTSAGAIVDEVTRLLGATLPAGVRVSTHVDGLVPNVLVDPTQIHQVLMNLGTNAWHAIDRPTGKIDFRLDAVVVTAEAPLEGLEPGEYARIRVTDDGRGIEPGHIDRIFEPFFTTKEVGKGTGLGLAVVHGIITDHEGAIAVDSSLGRGTTFSLFLPPAVVQGRLPTERPVGLVHQGSGRVLLIDDEPALVRVAQRLLTRAGYEVSGFTRVFEALAAVRAAPDSFDVVLTDQNMPDMGGFDVARAIAAIDLRLPVILVSGNQTHTDNELAQTNVRFQLEKPYTVASLTQVLRRALKET